MKGPLRLAYDAVAHIARTATAIVPAGDSKVIRAFTDRRGLLDRYVAWSSTHRDAARPLLWMHAPSVGEGLQARPILQRMRQRRGDVQLAYTFFSPTAVDFAQGLDVDFRDYLILDTARDSAAAIDALKPAALVFSKLDVWPNLTSAAARRGVKLGLTSATLAARSSRRSGVARALLRDAYASLDAVGAVDGADADRLIELGVRRTAIEVTGDTRYDQVWQRAAAIDPYRPEMVLLQSDRPTLVAGSTWPADEAVLLPAYVQLHRSSPQLRLIIAPHEPGPGHLEPLYAWARAAGLRHATLSDPSAAEADVVVVDRVGILGDLYALASFAYVGGAFHAAGLHSVLEPAAFGAPIMFGPRHEMSRDAGLLLTRGGAVMVSDERGFVSAIVRWLTDAEMRRAAGDTARAVVRDGLGAADRAYELVSRLVR